MDKNFYFQKRIEEQQREIAKELANRHLVKGLQHKPLNSKQVQGLLLRLVPIAVAIGIILLAVFG